MFKAGSFYHCPFLRFFRETHTPYRPQCLLICTSLHVGFACFHGSFLRLLGIQWFPPCHQLLPAEAPFPFLAAILDGHHLGWDPSRFHASAAFPGLAHWSMEMLLHPLPPQTWAVQTNNSSGELSFPPTTTASSQHLSAFRFPRSESRTSPLDSQHMLNPFTKLQVWGRDFPSSCPLWDKVCFTMRGTSVTLSHILLHKSLTIFS